jgi:hypothetical protein
VNRDRAAAGERHALGQFAGQEASRLGGEHGEQLGGQVDLAHLGKTPPAPGEHRREPGLVHLGPVRVREERPRQLEARTEGIEPGGVDGSGEVARPERIGQHRLGRFRGLGGGAPLLEGHRAIGESRQSLDTPRVLGEDEAVLVGQLFGEELEEPLGLDRAGHPDPHLGATRTGALLGIEREEQRRLLDHARRIEDCAPSSGEDQLRSMRFSAAGDAVGEAGEEREEQAVLALGRRSSMRAVQRARELPCGALHRLRGPAACSLPGAERLHLLQHVRAGAQGRHGPPRVPQARAGSRRPLGEDRGRAGRLGCDAAALALDQDSPQSGMHREGEEPPPELGEGSIRRTSTEAGQEVFRCLQRRGRGCLEPAEGARIGRAGSGEREHGFREVGAGDLREISLGPPVEVRCGVQPEADPGAGAARASASLRRAGLADGLDAQRGQPAPG